MSTTIAVSQTVLYYVWVNEEFEFTVDDEVTDDDIYHDREGLEERYSNEMYLAQDHQPYSDIFIGVPGYMDAEMVDVQDESWEVITRPDPTPEEL